MQQKYLLLLIFLIFGMNELRSQEYHWTLYNMSPLSVNPAKTGDFYGTFRVGGIYRNQYSGIASKAMNTPMIYVDAPLIKGFRDQDWIGVGGMLWQYKAGFLGFQNTGIYFSGAYHFALDKEAKSLISVGFQTGSISRKLDELDPNTDIFADELMGLMGMSPDRMGLTMEGESAVEYAGGIQLRAQVTQQARLTTGLRVGHIGDMNLALASGGSTLPKRWTAHGTLDLMVRPGVIISPSVLYDNYNPASEFLTQVEARVLINPEKNIDVSGGVGYRFGDAAQLMAGLGIGDLTVKMGFDLTLSELSDASVFGGFELAAAYIVKIFKEPKVDPVIFCPRF